MLKHEWIRTRALIGWIVGIAALLVVVGAVFVALDWPVLGALGQGFALAGLIAAIPVTQLALAFDFWRSSFGRTGYFTQTLPIPGARIFWAKLGWHLIVTVALLPVVAALGLVLISAANISAGLSANPFVQVRELWSQVTAATSPGQLILIAAMSLGLLAFLSVQYLFAASIGAEAPLHRFGASAPILVYVGLYLTLQVVTFGALLAIPFGLGMSEDGLAVVRFSLLEMMADGSSTADAMPLGFLPVFGLAALVLLWRTAKSWNSKISLG